MRLRSQQGEMSDSDTVFAIGCSVHPAIGKVCHRPAKHVNGFPMVIKIWIQAKLIGRLSRNQRQRIV